MTSLLNKVYYTLRPAIPRRVAIAARKLYARHLRAVSAAVWPIDERANTAPRGWPGWPDGKRFALVLTHDVEGCNGLSRIRHLMELEAKHGFRSSFNLVPEGSYRVSPELLSTLDNAGFEVGVHGLNHDGKLYFSKARFASKAAGIRRYVGEWKASGFRSPFMQHDLGVLHKLGVEYDSSTFDTDPFEPEPDGIGTIFPFWVPGPDGTGYVELPYTLCQDFTLFVILGEKSIDVWKSKLDWVAARGGMALLNTHPDYMDFETTGGRAEYPVSLYEEFLEYAREKYDGVFWPALPRDVSRFYTSRVPPAARASRKKICMVTHSVYEKDNRVRRYAEALARRGDQVNVIAIAGKEETIGADYVSGVYLHRIQRRTHEETESGRTPVQYSDSLRRVQRG